MRTSVGSSIRGRIVFEPALGATVPNPWDVGLSPIPVDYDLSPQGNFASADIKPDGSFAIEGISGPRRLEVITAPPGWVLKEIRAGGINVTDQVLPFGTADESLRDVEVVLTDRVSELIGSVRDDRARPMAATLIVFSTDRSHWYPRSRHVQRSRTETDGSFSVSRASSRAVLRRPGARGPDRRRRRVAGACFPGVAHSRGVERPHRRRRQGVGEFQTVRPMTQHESCGFIPMCG